MKGWVYVISNKAMTAIKVGYTTRSPEERAAELNHTGSPHPYLVDYAAQVDNPHELEQRVHKRLAPFHEGKEWFNCTSEKAVVAIQSEVIGALYYEKFPRADREKAEKIKKQEEYDRVNKLGEEKRKKQEEEWNKNVINDEKEKITKHYKTILEEKFPLRPFWNYWLLTSVSTSLLLGLILESDPTSIIWLSIFIGAIASFYLKTTSDIRTESSHQYQLLISEKDARIKAMELEIHASGATASTASDTAYIPKLINPPSRQLFLVSEQPAKIPPGDSTKKTQIQPARHAIPKPLNIPPRQLLQVSDTATERQVFEASQRRIQKLNGVCYELLILIRSYDKIDYDKEAMIRLKKYCEFLIISESATREEILATTELRIKETQNACLKLKEESQATHQFYPTPQTQPDHKTTPPGVSTEALRPNGAVFGFWIFASVLGLILWMMFITASVNQPVTKEHQNPVASKAESTSDKSVTTLGVSPPLTKQQQEPADVSKSHTPINSISNNVFYAFIESIHHETKLLYINISIVTGTKKDCRKVLEKAKDSMPEIVNITKSACYAFLPSNLSPAIENKPIKDAIYVSFTDTWPVRGIYFNIEPKLSTQDACSILLSELKNYGPQYGSNARCVSGLSR